MKKIILTVFASILLISCATLKSVPEDLTASQIIQMGQNYLVAGDYKSAELCYSTVLERYGTNAATYVEAKYELAHLYVKRKKYEKARNALNEILEIYDFAPAGALSPSYKKLAQIEMAKIPD